MKKHLRIISRCAFLTGWLLALCYLLVPGRATAAPATAGGILPLPDLLLYGTVTDSNGDLLGSGTIKAMTRGQTIATASIGSVNGNDYTYLLVVPMAMLSPGGVVSPTDRALTDDVLSFFVDNEPAYYQDPVTGLTVTELRVPVNGPGTGLVLDLNLPGALHFLVGDVNASGARNSADAMLALKYDIGLIAGVTTFPPGPNTVYLPLCDVVENGRCDSSDALRILQCDVGMPGVTCPTEEFAARTHVQQVPTVGAPLSLHLTATPGVEVDTVAVQVVLGDPAAQFGAATLELDYDPTLFAVSDCAENPAAALDGVSCNGSYEPGVVRFNAIASAGGVDGAPLVEVHFKRLGATSADLTARFGLRADGVYDRAGADLAWSDGSVAAAPSAAWFKVYMPTVAGQTGRADTSGLDGPEEPAAPAIFDYRLHLPVIGSLPEGAAEVDAAPDVEGAPTAVVTETIEPEPVVEPTPTPEASPNAPPPERPGGSMPPPESTLVADLPHNDPLGDESEDGRLYLPLVTEE